MLTILVPTSFSAQDVKAFYYAAQIANQTKSRLIIGHCHHVPVLNSTNKDLQISDLLTIVEKYIPGGFSSSLRNLAPTNFWENISFEYRFIGSLNTGTFKRLAFAEKAHLMVLGQPGPDTHVLQKWWNGNTLDNLIGQVLPCSILTVPEHSVAQSIDCLTLATSLETKESTLKQVRQFARYLNTEVKMVHIDQKDNPESSNKKRHIALQNQCSKLLREIPHELAFRHHEKVADGISEFVEEENAGLLCLAPKSQSSIIRFLRSGTSKGLLQKAAFPILFLAQQARVFPLPKVQPVALEAYS